MKKTIIIAAIMLLVAGTASLDARTKKSNKAKQSKATATQVIYTGDIASKVVGYNGPTPLNITVKNGVIENIEAAAPPRRFSRSTSARPSPRPRSFTPTSPQEPPTPAMRSSRTSSWALIKRNPLPPRKKRPLRRKPLRSAAEPSHLER